MSKKDLGRVHVYTGLGKGKTTSAMGLAARAIGHGYRVAVIRFMADHKEPGEWLLQKKLAPQLEVLNFGQAVTKNIHNTNASTMDSYLAQRAMEYARKILETKRRPDVLILDEINPAIYAGMLTPKEVVDFLRHVPATTEVVLTGRYAHPDVVAIADIVTEMKPLKIYQGPPRRGIEF
jgi:cob(I)alamin adenosyltransferase